MVAATVEMDPSEHSPWRPPYTVDTLFELPETDLRFEVLGGNLVVAPAPTTAHNSIIDRLHRRFASALPADLRLLHGNAVRRRWRSDQTSTTFRTIIGRRRYVSLTQRPTVRRTICWSWCGSVIPSRAARSSASVTSGITGSNTAGSSEKPLADTVGPPTTF